MHVALGLIRRDRVDQLVHARHAKGGDIDALRLTTLEHGRAMRRREQVDLRGERTDLGDRATVDADPIVDDALAHQLLGQRSDRTLDLALTLREALSELRDDLGTSGVESLVALRLGRLHVGGGQSIGADLLDGGEDIIGVVRTDRVGHRGDRAALSHEVSNELALQKDGLTDPDLGGLKSGGKDVLVNLGSASGVHVEAALGPTGLHHHDGDVGVVGVAQGATGDHELEGRLVALLERGVRDPRAISRVGHPDGTDGAVEGDAGQHQRC